MSNIINNVISSMYSKVNSRYVNTFVPVSKDFKKGKTDLSSNEQDLLSELNQVAQNVQKLAEKYPVIKEIDELLYLEVLDFPDLVFTFHIYQGLCSVQPGYRGEVTASYNIPLYSHNIHHLKNITDDGDLSLDDIYRITRVLFIPFLQGLYNGDYTKMPKDKAYLQLDNFIQVEVRGPEGVVVEGFEGPAKATVVNVDGQWLMFEGFQGDPDVRYVMNIQQALRFAYLISVKIIGGAKKEMSLTQLAPYVKEYNELKKIVQTYERSWHVVEDSK